MATAFWDVVMLAGGARTVQGIINHDKTQTTEGVHVMTNVVMGEIVGSLFGTIFRQGNNLFKSVEVKAINSVFRGDTRSPTDIFKSGFEAKGTSTDVVDYVETNAPSIFVGTSKSSSQAALKASNGYIYVINDTGTGTNVNNYYKALEGRENPFSQEEEVIFEGQIKNNQIKGAYQIKNGKIDTKHFIVNPNYKP